MRAENLAHHKSQHADAYLSDTLSGAKVSNMSRPVIKLHSEAFYDLLSKVWLTRRALKELDRRARKANDNLHRLASTSWQEYKGDIWKKQIQQFARHGGPELSELRQYSDQTNPDNTHAMSSTPNRELSLSPPKTRNKRTSAYDNDFEQYLAEHHVFPVGYAHSDGRRKPKPAMEDIHTMLGQRRQSLSSPRFTSEDFEHFKQANDQVLSEAKVSSTILPIICGSSSLPNEMDLVFTEMKPIADVIVDSKPDFYDGAHLAAVDKRVQTDIRGFIIPSKHQKAPVAPNFFLELKGPMGATDVAKRQACYDGAMGARAMHQLQSYRQEKPIYDDKAYTITSTYHGGMLNMYTTHPTQSTYGVTEYHMTQINSWSLIGNLKTFLEGVTAFRNARDWAQAQRNHFISIANSRARAMDDQLSDPVPSADIDALANADSQVDTYLSRAEILEDDDGANTTYTNSNDELASSQSNSNLAHNKARSNIRRTRSSPKAVQKAARHSESRRRRRRFKK